MSGLSGFSRCCDLVNGLNDTFVDLGIASEDSGVLSPIEALYFEGAALESAYAITVANQSMCKIFVMRLKFPLE